jgi:hypothetical protein
MQRWLGLLWLAIAAGMLNWGHLILQPLLHGWVFVTYWVVCIAFALAAVVFAIVDVCAVRRNIRAAHRELARRFIGKAREARRTIR